MITANTTADRNENSRLIRTLLGDLIGVMSLFGILWLGLFSGYVLGVG
ncbi:hypothetical protein [Celeribacter sp.]